MKFRGPGNVHEQHREQLDAFVHDLLGAGEQIEVMLLAFTGNMQVRWTAHADITWYSVVVTDRRVFCLLWNLALREPLSVHWSAPRSEVSVKWRPPRFPWWVYVLVARSQKELVLDRAGYEPTRLGVITLRQLLVDAEKVASSLATPGSAFR
jgi:hypothetical protein